MRDRSTASATTSWCLVTHHKEQQCGLESVQRHVGSPSLAIKHALFRLQLYTPPAPPFAACCSMCERRSTSRMTKLNESGPKPCRYIGRMPAVLGICVDVVHYHFRLLLGQSHMSLDQGHLSGQYSMAPVQCASGCVISIKSFSPHRAKRSQPMLPCPGPPHAEQERQEGQATSAWHLSVGNKI